MPYTVCGRVPLQGGGTAVQLQRSDGAKKWIKIKGGSLLSKLISAIERDDMQKVQELLSPELVNAKDEYGNTLLFYAKSVECAQYLIDKGAIVNAVSIGGVTPLSLALNKGRGMVKLLMDHYPTPDSLTRDINKVYSTGENLLIKAAKLHNPDIVSLFLAHGANVNAVDRNHYTALHTVLNSYDSENVTAIVKLLLARGANVSLRTVYEFKTALMFAAAHLHQEAVELLLKADNAALVNAVTHNGANALRLVSGKEDTKDFDKALKVARILMNAGSDVSTNSIKTAINMCNQKMVKLFLYSRRFNPLEFQVVYGHAKISSKYCDLSMLFADFQRAVALSSAAKIPFGTDPNRNTIQNELQFVKGMDLDDVSAARDAEGYTALGNAARSGALRNLKLLIQSGIDFRVPGNEQGDSYQTIAKNYGHAHIADPKLLEYLLPRMLDPLIVSQVRKVASKREGGVILPQDTERLLRSFLRPGSIPLAAPPQPPPPQPPPPTIKDATGEVEPEAKRARITFISK